MSKYYSNTHKINGNEINVWRINNCINGNPRYVIHFLDLADTYEKAIKKIHEIGGRKYTAKWFGGGVVFSSYNIREDLERIVPVATPADKDKTLEEVIEQILTRFDLSDDVSDAEYTCYQFAFDTLLTDLSV